MGTPTDGDWERMRVHIARLRNQLWDATRQMELVQRTFPRDRLVGRARKDVSAALHESYLAMTVWKEARGAPILQAPDAPSPASD